MPDAGQIHLYVMEMVDRMDIPVYYQHNEYIQ